MRLSDVLGVSVATESGDQLGSVHDVRAERRGGSIEVVGLVVGGKGLLERLGVQALHHHLRIIGGDMIPWEKVVRADRGGVVVRDDAKPR